MLQRIFEFIWFYVLREVLEMRITIDNLMSAFFQIIIGFILICVNNIQLSFVLIFVEFFFLISRYIMKGFYKNAAYIAFLSCLFTFLMGGFLINIGRIDYFTLFSHDAYIHIARCLFISMFFSSITYDKTSANEDSKKINFKISSDTKIIKIRKAALYLYYGFCIFSIAVNAEKVLFVGSNSYLDYYTEYATRLPGVFFNLATLSEFSFYVFIATIPPKKQCMKPIALFLLIAAMSLGYGQRNGFVVSLLLVVVYYTIRHMLDGEKWISKKLATATLIAIPFFIAALFAFNYTRSNQEVKVTGLGNQIVAFFDEQSVSSKIIGYGYEYKDDIKTNGVNYSVSQITNIVTQNEIVKRLFNIKTYSGKTVANALYGTQFSKAITYKVMPHNYLNGIGMGTTYVAEVYHDFGYIGVILINILYGYFLALFQKKRFALLVKRVHPYIIAILFMGLTNILYAPRSITFGFVSQTLTITTLIAVALIHFLSKTVKVKVKSDDKI